ncbi:MAG TPA: plastocyanin/azurin family copper-binding protein [Acidimicrobiales bacterium]
MRRRRAALATLALLLAVGAAAGCGGDDGDDGDGGLASGDADAGGGVPAGAPDDVVVLDGSDVDVQALDNTFRAQNVQVRPGTSVTWTNVGRNEHDVLPAEGDAWGVEVDDFQPGDVYSHTFDDPGVYHYYCSIHGTTTAGMIGAVVVEDD